MNLLPRFENPARMVLAAGLIAALMALLTLAWWAYQPGLGGGFQFDDYANLPAIGATGPVNDWPTFWRYITSGHADPTGRPVALLSFLLDSTNWPASPRPFLRTNILLHLLNGALLFLLLRNLGRELTRRTLPGRPRPLATRVNLAALLGAGLWLLHPLLVSTTLYIVQREAMLPATFTLLGLLAWLHGRQRLHAGAVKRALAWLVLGLGVCTALGVLSKANGILLPALALVIEATVLRPSRAAPAAAWPNRQRQGIYRTAMVILAGLPTAFVAAYLVYRGYNGITHGISATRPWTLTQRLLTEPRVLMDYLQLLWLPHPFTPGLFNDQIQASSGLLTPWTTLPCLLAVLGLIIGACVLHQRWPALALAVLFYMVGQSLESSTVALELYFEHRNYLPSLLLFWPLALWLCSVPQRPARSRHHSLAPTSRRQPAAGWAKAVLALALLATVTGMTHARATVWGNTHTQALLWARLNPASPRAQTNAAMAQMRAGHPARAARRLRQLLAHDPSQVQLAFNLFAAQCQLGHVPPATLQAARTALATTRNPGTLLAHWFGRVIGQVPHPPCPQLNYATLIGLIHAGQSNPRLMAIRGRRQDLESMLGRIALARKQPDQALADFNQALAQDVRASAAFAQAAQLGAHGYPERGLAHLDFYQQLLQRKPPHTPRLGMRRIHAWVLHKQGYWPKEQAYLRGVLQGDIRARHVSSPSRPPSNPPDALK